MPHKTKNELKSNKLISNEFKSYITILELFKKIRWCVLALIFYSTSVFAQASGSIGDRSGPDPLDASDDNSSIQRVEEAKETKGKGWQLSTKGGLKYINPSDETYWFAVAGVIRLDQIFYSGNELDKQGQFPNNGLIRRIEPGFDGGIGKNWEYSINMSFSSLSNTRGILNGLHARLQDSWIGYTGFSKNSELFFGRISGNWFGLEGSTGGTWMAFMERSAQANAFYPGDGVGIMGDIWWKNGAITALLLGHDQGDHIGIEDILSRPLTPRSDRLRAILRITYAPVHCLGDVWHFGISDAYIRHDALLFDRVIRVVVAGSIPTAGFAQRDTRRGLLSARCSATYTNAWNVEMARQIGPFIASAEYTDMYVHRVSNVLGPLSQGSLHLTGYNLQASYILTGEAHSYDVRDGSFGSIDICSPYGAWEAAIRYDYLNLNDKDVHGGSQHNLTVGLNWFVNVNLRLSANYIRSSFRAAHSVPVRAVPNQTLHRTLDAIGLRLQLKFK